jgi:hypothetical protein
VTDARYPDYWMHDARVQGLSGDDFRAFIHALAWSAHNRTDGVIRPENLTQIPRLDAATMAVFVDAELCAKLTGGWLILDYLATQTSRAQFEQRDRARANNARRKAEQRDRDRTAAQGGVTRDVMRDVTAPFTGKARQGISSNVSSSSRNRSLDKKPQQANSPSENSHEELTDAERDWLTAKADRLTREQYDQ